MSITSSQSRRAGSPSSRNAASKAIISASVDECDTAVCFLHSQEIGAKVLVPTRARKHPVVDFESRKSPAKEASQKRASVISFAWSPIHEV